ncbi:MAG: hypothetical protein K8R85_00640 [Bacteroidetes bacterium]|nr:hypothetical protein [Bacteroidota bacterium]
MFSYHHTNNSESMLLNIISSIIAFALGAISVVEVSYPTILLNLQSFFTHDTIQFLFRSAIGGFIALFVKVVGDMIIHKLKNRKDGR